MRDIATNAKARRDFHILQTLETGIVLRGTEAKALRAGKGQIGESFARIEGGEVWLHNVHIDEYAFGNRQNHAPKAARKLLLHRNEIRKLEEAAAVKGQSLVPLSLYWKDGRVKVALAVARGKHEFDKREDLKRRDSDRDLRRALSHQAHRPDR